MVYTTFADVNLITNITSSDVANADVTSIIAEATKELNSMINARVTREWVLFIDSTRENNLDGGNTTFYVRNWFGKFLADMNDDGSITTADVEVILVDTNNDESIATVSSVDASLGQFVLNTAPDSTNKMFVTYEWCYKDPTTPDPLIKLACTFLSAAYCYAKLNIGRGPQVKFGNTRFYRDMGSFDKYYQRAIQVMNQINESGGLADYSESKVV